MRHADSFIVTVVIAVWLHAIPVAAQSPIETQKVEQAQKQAVVELRPTLPRKIDEMTTMTDVAASGVVLSYTYVVEFTKFEMPSNFIKLVQKNTTSIVCKTESLMDAMKLGAVYRYIYVDPQSKPLGQFDVKLKDCA